MKSGRVTIVEGDIRDRALLGDVMHRIDVVFHQAAIRITQCAEEPALAMDVLVKDRKSTRLNSSHLVISYAVFCLKKKTRNAQPRHPPEQTQPLTRAAFSTTVPRGLHPRPKRAPVTTRLPRVPGRPHARAPVTSPD